MNDKEAILLAGGSGSRLRPFTFYTSKHLLPIDNVPMIFYPLKNLALLGVSKVFLIINENHLNQWNKLISEYDFNMEIVLVVQDKPLGIPDAILKCESKIKGDSFVVSLGDNVIIASNFINRCKESFSKNDYATICAFTVSDAKPFGVAKFDDHGSLIEIIEKPDNPPSNKAIIGFYNFPKNSFKKIKDLEFSDRGELEIADLINAYIAENRCKLIESDSISDFWLDTGTNESMVVATNFIRDLKRNHGLEIGQFNPKEV